MSETQLVILVVEDSPEDREIARRSFMKDSRYVPIIHEAGTGAEGLALYWSLAPDAVILDYNLPDIDGLEVLSEIRAANPDGFLPVIILTGQGNELVAVEALKGGAADYLVKDMEGRFTKLLPMAVERMRHQKQLLEDKVRAEEELRASEARYRAVVEDQTELICRFSPDFGLSFVNGAFGRYFGRETAELVGTSLLDILPGEARIVFQRAVQALKPERLLDHFDHPIMKGTIQECWLDWTVRAIIDSGGLAREIQAVGRDVTESRLLQEELRCQAITDALTGAFNRRHFFERGDQEIQRGQRYGRSLAVIMLDIDHFKSINDRFGHSAGDRALRELTATCRQILRSNDIIGRIGGEEFGLVMPETNFEEAMDVAQRLRQTLAGQEIAAAGQVFGLTVSIGVTDRRDDERDFEIVLKRADDALYRAKVEGRNLVRGLR